jgi:uncharacterized membrane protein
MVIGLWMISDPVTFDFAKKTTTYATMSCGLGFIILSFFALHPYRIWPKWGIIIIGFILYIIPIVFWSETAAAYSSLTILATIIIALNMLVPNIPGIYLIRSPGPIRPPGWSYNPSSWEERIPVITFAWIGFLVARYLASYQLEYISYIPDPAFGEGTMNVLDSEVSKSFPISDAALGAFSYLLDVLMGYLGSTARWRTMPWVVIIFAILIIPLGVVSITLVILQPVAVGSWCFYCLITAAISLIMMPFTFDEAAASSEFLIKARREGQSFWKVFWKGGTLKDWPEEDYPYYQQNRLITSTIKELFGDLGTVPWTLAVCAGIGVWVMIMPSLLGYSETPAANSNIISGALITTFSIATMSEVARAGRFINILIGIWLAISVFFFNPDINHFQWVHWVTAAALIALTIPPGPFKEKHGMFNKYKR